MRGQGGLRRLEVGIREIGSRRDAELGKGSAGWDRHARDRRNHLVREIQPLVQLDLANHDVEPATERQPRRHLVGERGLDVDRAQDVLVAGEAAVEGQRPLGLQAVGREQPHADSQPRARGIGNVRLGHCQERVVQTRLLVEDVVREAALDVDQRHASGCVPTFQAGEACRVEEHRRAVGARRRHAGTGPSHRAGTLLVDAEPLRIEQGGDPGEQQPQR